MKMLSLPILEFCRFRSFGRLMFFLKISLKLSSMMAHIWVNQNVAVSRNIETFHRLVDTCIVTFTNIAETTILDDNRLFLFYHGCEARYEQFLILLQSFQHNLIIKLSLIDIFHIFAETFSNLSAADVLYVGKGYSLYYLVQNDDKHFRRVNYFWP